LGAFLFSQEANQAMKINQANYFIIVAWILLSILSGCKKEAVKVLNDYLPLTVGAKYKYNYSARYGYSPENTIKTGECTWNFISKSADTSVVYHVEQSFNGKSVWTDQFGKKDSAQIVNQISALSFEVLNDGRVAFTWPQEKVTLERFIQSDRNDTCFRSSPYEQVCLRKNVGITSLFSLPMHGNHQKGSGYTLIEGPYY